LPRDQLGNGFRGWSARGKTADGRWGAFHFLTTDDRKPKKAPLFLNIPPPLSAKIQGVLGIVQKVECNRGGTDRKKVVDRFFFFFA
jgi:hypothetical protein